MRTGSFRSVALKLVSFHVGKAFGFGSCSRRRDVYNQRDQDKHCYPAILQHVVPPLVLQTRLGRAAVGCVGACSITIPGTAAGRHPAVECTAAGPPGRKEAVPAEDFIF